MGALTQPTDQERAEFEVWYQSRLVTEVEESFKRHLDGYWCTSVDQAWDIWQAARRAPVVPQGWKLVPAEPTPAQLLTVYKKTGVARSELQELWNDLLAATPQPPEVECMTCNGYGAVGNPTNTEPCPDCTSRGQLAEAVPAQLPDALLTLETNAHYIFNNPPGECPQAVRDVIEWYAASVRQLLATQEQSK